MVFTARSIVEKIALKWFNAHVQETVPNHAWHNLNMPKTKWRARNCMPLWTWFLVTTVSLVVYFMESIFEQVGPRTKGLTEPVRLLLLVNIGFM